MNTDLNVVVFSNLIISSVERLGFMNKSLISLKEVEFIKWYVNVRGEFKDEASTILAKSLGDKLILTHMESKSGWIKDTQKLFKEVKSSYIFYWVEDHILQIHPSLLVEVFQDMSKYSVDYLHYSFYGFGSHYTEFSLISDKEEYRHFDVINYTNEKNLIRQDCAVSLYNKKAYIVSLIGIFSNNFFKKILYEPPFFRLRRWPKETPFDFEQSSDDLWVLPIRMAIPKFEISCSIDDDNCIPESSLMARKLFEASISRQSLMQKERRIPKENSLKKVFRVALCIPGSRKIYNFCRRISYYF